MFLHLRTHSYYSLLEGLPSPKQLVQAAVNQGLPALGLTDRNILVGAIEFYQACKEANIQPILGLELEISLPSRLQPQHLDNQDITIPTRLLTLFAMDLNGWQNLCELSSLLVGEEQNILAGSLPFESLFNRSGGCICLVCSENKQVNSWIKHHQDRQVMEYIQRLGELFTDRLYIEIQTTSINNPTSNLQLANLARQMSLPVVAIHPVYFLNPEHHHLQKLMTAIRLNCHIEDLLEGQFAPKEAFFVKVAEMDKQFINYPEALANNQEIARRCQLVLPLGQSHLPDIASPNRRKPSQELKEKAIHGALRLYGEITHEMQTRLNHELNVIEDKGFTSLFLIMDEIIQFARQADIPTASRGSASSSLVAHCLGITTPDPIRLNLYFERFLNPARSTPPDIDTDLCSRRRDEVINHVYQTYGKERVAMVGTINRFRARSALREVAKAYGLPLAEINALCKAIPWRGWIPAQNNHKNQNWSPYQELSTRYPETKYQQIFRDALSLIEIPHHLSVHAGGIVISAGEMTDLVPVMMANKGIQITQFDLDSIEQLGLVKLDLLGIRGLSVLGDVAEAIKNRGTMPGCNSRLAVLDAIPGDDPQTAEIIRNGKTIGCFQIESPGMRATLCEIKASSIDDVMVALALYRPGPLSGGLKEAFVRRHLGKETITHLHPSLENLLGDTYGVILYQEQVLRIGHELGGLNLAEADLLRRAMSHFDPGKQMQNLKDKFITNAQNNHGVPLETSQRIWELMSAFAGYGFPKAHAASYAQVAWRAAWCKAHFPAEFMAGVLANWGGYYSQRVYLMECRRLGLKVKPPHINYAQSEFSVSYQGNQPVLYMGLDQVRDLTRRTQRNILQYRPFNSLEEFIARANPRPLEAENLIRAGALQGLGNIPDLLYRLKSNHQPPGQIPLFSLTSAGTRQQESNDWSAKELAAQQEAVLGISVDFHPIELVSQQINQLNVLTTSEAIDQQGKRLRVAGIRQTWRRLPGVKGDYTMTLEDLEGVLEVLIPANLYRQQRLVFSSRHPLVVEGVVELDPESTEIYLRAEKAWLIS